ncbi:biglycan [Platysternon megacephalum]|uniref:Biglycan n=1 Tax=Platysternon megacephalum TaxID=55544 RepID=A0A4D9DJ11_9SAUR|nr:biglycan [Platysternon megacephalum]
MGPEGRRRPSHPMPPARCPSLLWLALPVHSIPPSAPAGGYPEVGKGAAGPASGAGGRDAAAALKAARLTTAAGLTKQRGSIAAVATATAVHPAWQQETRGRGSNRAPLCPASRSPSFSQAGGG